MSRMLPMDTLETLHFLKQSMESLKGSYNNPASVSLRIQHRRLVVIVAGYDIITARQSEHDHNRWQVEVEIAGFEGRFHLSPSTPHRLVVVEVVGKQRAYLSPLEKEVEKHEPV